MVLQEAEQQKAYAEEEERRLEADRLRKARAAVGNFSSITIRATEILKSKSVRSTDDVLGTCVRQSQIVMKTNDSSFSYKSVSEIDYLSNTL